MTPVDNIRASRMSTLVDTSVGGVGGGVEVVSVDTSVDGVNGVKRVSSQGSSAFMR